MPGGWLRGLGRWWRRYKYRFVPWVALNLSRNARTLRFVPEGVRDKVTADEVALRTLRDLFRALLANDARAQRDPPAAPPEPAGAAFGGRRAKASEPAEILRETLGFSVARASSSLVSAGSGVFVAKGSAPRGAVVAMYPGTVYQRHEPVFFQSIGNPFIFRCLDGILIDGNDKGLSRVVYRSCAGRDRLGPLQMSDSSWLTAELQNPLAVGQYVNNCSNDRAANVCYQELDVPTRFPLELRQYLPNVAYRCDGPRPLRCVVLVALRDIGQGEELFSNYYTIVGG